MPSFIEERLLDCVAYGTSGGPTWRTRRILLKSGIVRRNPMRSRPMYQYNVLYRNLQRADHMEVISAFNACYGGVFSFRLKDWQDFQLENELLNVVGTGSSQTVQLTKAYTFGSSTVYRLIRKPVSGTITMTHNNAALTASIDYTTGLATFTTTAGHLIRASGQFDTPVMFEQDELPFTGDNKNANGLFLTADVPLIEDLDV